MLIEKLFVNFTVVRDRNGALFIVKMINALHPALDSAICAGRTNDGCRQPSHSRKETSGHITGAYGIRKQSMALQARGMLCAVCHRVPHLA